MTATIAQLGVAEAEAAARAGQPTLVRYGSGARKIRIASVDEPHHHAAREEPYQPGHARRRQPAPHARPPRGR